MSATSTPPANAPTAPHDTSVPAGVPVVAEQAESQVPQTLIQRLNVAEQHWIWKASLRSVLVITGLIGTGCIAWAFSRAADGPYTYALDDRWSIVWALVTFGISIIWCAICILVLLLRRPNAPVHPGVAVGIDLLLWLAFIPTVMFCIIGVVSVIDWGSDGTIGQYSAYGYYYRVSNGSWVWNATEYDTYFGRSRDCCPNSNSYPNPDYTYCFSDCALEDQYVNNLWKEKPTRVGVEMTGTVCQFIGLLLHFALFVWACVDTHRRNKSKTSKEAEKLAGDIVMNMVRSGALVRAAPAQGYSMISEQERHGQHVQQHPGWYQPQPVWQQQAGPSAQGGVAIGGPHGSVRKAEKGDSSRFA